MEIPLPEIQFPDSQPTITANRTLAFDAIVDGQNETCEISFEALKDHFAASSDKERDLLVAFIKGKTRIHEVARRKWPDLVDRWLLVTADFYT
jgi:uncharacterized protein DUF1488